MQKHLVAFKGQEVSSSVLMYENDLSSVFGSDFLSPFYILLIKYTEMTTSQKSYHARIPFSSFLDPLEKILTKMIKIVNVSFSFSLIFLL